MISIVRYCDEYYLWLPYLNSKMGWIFASVILKMIFKLVRWRSWAPDSLSMNLQTYLNFLESDRLGQDQIKCWRSNSNLLCNILLVQYDPGEINWRKLHARLIKLKQESLWGLYPSSLWIITSVFWQCRLIRRVRLESSKLTNQTR